MERAGVDVVLLSIGADLPYLTGYEAMPLERLTMLVLPRTGDARLVVPRLEAPRVTPRPELFDMVPWAETDDPVALVARIVGESRSAIRPGPASRSISKRPCPVRSSPARPRSSDRFGA